MKEYPTPSRPAVVIGGTGMLRAAALALAGVRPAVTVVARRQARLAALAEESGGRVHPLPLDYTAPGALADGLHRATGENGAPDLIVAWLHEDGLPSLPEAAAALAETAASRLFLVRSSVCAAPDAREHPAVAAVRCGLAGRFREVVLGWLPAGRGSRWLTPAEISSGVLQAIAADLPRHVVGVVSPWSSRP